MALYFFQGVGGKEKIIAPASINDIKMDSDKTLGFSKRVRAFDRGGLPGNGERCTVTWRVKRGRPFPKMLVRRAGEEVKEELGLIHISSKDTPVDIFDPKTGALLERIISRG